MKKLLLKCALLIFILGGILSLGSVAYKHTNAEENLERMEGTEGFREMPERIEIAVFGSSHGQADFKNAPGDAVMFNFALSSQTPQYDAAMLRQFQDRLEPNALVIMTASYLSPYWTDKKAAFQQKQSRYYRILSPENIVDVSISRYWLGRLCPILTVELREIASAFLKSTDLIPTTDERDGHNRLSDEDIPDEQARVGANHWSIISPVYPEVNPTMWDAWREMLTLCRENGWKAVLVTPPYPEVYNECFPVGFYEEFLNRMNEISTEYGVPYLDYSHAPGFVKRLDYFKDIDHLNLDGAAEFNRRFFEDVQALGLLP